MRSRPPCYLCIAHQRHHSHMVHGILPLYPQGPTEIKKECKASRRAQSDQRDIHDGRGLLSRGGESFCFYLQSHHLMEGASFEGVIASSVGVALLRIAVHDAVIPCLQWSLSKHGYLLGEAPCGSFQMASSPSNAEFPGTWSSRPTNVGDLGPNAANCVVMKVSTSRHTLCRPLNAQTAVLLLTHRKMHGQHLNPSAQETTVGISDGSDAHLGDKHRQGGTLRGSVCTQEDAVPPCSDTKCSDAQSVALLDAWHTADACHEAGIQRRDTHKGGALYAARDGRVPRPDHIFLTAHDRTRQLCVPMSTTLGEVWHAAKCPPLPLKAGTMYLHHPERTLASCGITSGAMLERMGGLRDGSPASRLEGWLQKRSPTFPFQWQRRWFVLTLELAYYRHEGCEHLANSIPLSSICGVQIKGGSEFTVQANERSYALRASHAEVVQWRQAFQLADEPAPVDVPDADADADPFDGALQRQQASGGDVCMTVTMQLALRVRGGGCCHSKNTARGSLAAGTASVKIVVRDVPPSAPTPDSEQVPTTAPAAPTSVAPPAGAPTRTSTLARAPTAATAAISGEESASAEWRLHVIGQAKQMQRADSRKYAGAELLFGPDGLSPSFWGVSKEQLREFRRRVTTAMADGTLTRPHTDDPSHQHFDDPTIGPKMYQVTDQLLKKLTAKHDVMPGASYGVQCNLETGGLRCELFISHVWSEGVYEFIDHALAAWPDECEGAYICTLSNPQNLDIGTLLGKDPHESPFYRVLHAEPRPRMLMLANRYTPIHKRLWCVYEAFLAHVLHIDVRIAGEALHLLSGDLADFLRLKEGAALRMVEEARKPVHDAVAALERQGAAELNTLLPRVDAAFEEVARAKLRVLRSEDATLVNFEDATCFSEDDRKAIRNDIGDRSHAAASFVAGLVRDAVCGSVAGLVRDAVCGSVASGASEMALDDSDFTAPTTTLALVARMWLGRATITRLQLRRCVFSQESVLEVQHATRWLTKLQVRARCCNTLFVLPH